LRIVVIGTRVGKYEGLKSESSPAFDPDTDVLGVTELIKQISKLDTNRLRRLVELINHEMPAANSMSVPTVPTVRFENAEIIGGNGSVGSGGDVRIKWTKGSDVTIVGGTIKGGDGGDDGGKGGDAIIEGSDAS
jgi:hypothetical protein